MILLCTVRKLCLISLFKSEKIQNLMREGGKNEGDEIKKALDKFLEKLMRATK